MRLAALLGMRSPTLGLIALRDDSWAYIVRRFDRSDDDPPQKRDRRDFCQLLGRSPELKDGLREDCARVIKRDIADSSAALRELFLLFLGCYWLGNGDLHLKNISLLADDDGQIHLSPVYNIVCTTLYNINAPVLSMAGAVKNLQWSHFVDFGVNTCGLTRSDALDDASAATNPRPARSSSAPSPAQRIQGAIQALAAQALRVLRVPPT